MANQDFKDFNTRIKKAAYELEKSKYEIEAQMIGDEIISIIMSIPKFTESQQEDLAEKINVFSRKVAGLALCSYKIKELEK